MRFATDTFMSQGNEKSRPAPIDQSERAPDYNREIRSEQRSATNIQSSRAVSYTRGGSSGGGGGGY